MFPAKIYYDYPMNIATTHPTLVLVRGLPGSGKTYLATALKKELGEDNVVTLDPDATDYNSIEYTEMSAKLTAEGVDTKFFPYRFLRFQAWEGIENNKIIIWNQAFTNLDGFNKTVVNLQTYASEHGKHLPLLVVEVEVEHPVAKERVAKRRNEGGHDVAEEAWDRFIKEYRSFSEEGFNTVAVHGQDDVAKSVDAVVAALQKLWEQ